MQPPASSHFEIYTLELWKENSFLPGHTNGQHHSYEFIWLRNGAGSVTIDLQEYRIGSKTICCLSPGCSRWFGGDYNMEGYFISLSADFFYTAEPTMGYSFLPAAYEMDKGPVFIPVQEEAWAELEEIFAKMEKEFTHRYLLGDAMLKGLFRIFLVYLSRNAVVKGSCQTNTIDKSLAIKFTQLLASYFTTKKMVADYADELCVTPGYLNQVVKRVSGFTASHHIQQYVIREAKRQAIQQGKSMKEIAYGLGFDDSAHFSKFFKANSGTSFTSFRKAIR